jgi:hypothetical protein
MKANDENSDSSNQVIVCNCSSLWQLPNRNYFFIRNNDETYDALNSIQYTNSHQPVEITDWNIFKLHADEQPPKTNDKLQQKSFVSWQNLLNIIL